jgi:hypothetical protein
MKYTYRIENPNGKVGPAWGATYTSLALAKRMVAIEYGVREVVQTEWVYTGSGEDCALLYTSKLSMENDPFDGSWAPRVYRSEKKPAKHPQLVERPVCETSIASPGCRGWGWFNGQEIQRCDECKTFESDAEACAHVAGCPTCQRELGRIIAEEQVST